MLLRNSFLQEILSSCYWKQQYSRSWRYTEQTRPSSSFAIRELTFYEEQTNSKYVICPKSLNMF